MNPSNETIRSFLLRRTRAAAIDDDDDIFARGLVDSMFALQLVMFIEREFAIAIENEDLDLGNFRTVAAISALVARKVAPRSAA